MPTKDAVEPFSVGRSLLRPTPVVLSTSAASTRERPIKLFPGLRLVRLFVLDVALRIAVDRFEVLGNERAPQFPRLPHEEATRRHDGAFRHKRAGGDYSSNSDFWRLEDDAAHSDQAPRFNRA